MIPMRDGVRLHTLIYTPQHAVVKLPFLISRWPYGFPDGAPLRILQSSYKELADDGYIFVFQDIRGRYQSEGQFVMLRPVRDKKDPKAIDESTDAYDTIDWLLKNVPNNNGRAGILGVSYGGWLTVMAMIDPHPALKAASEQASPADMYLGDDFHHNGAFRLSYGFEYVNQMETGKQNFSFHFNKADTFEWYLALGPLSRIDKEYFHGEKPTWTDFVEHPNYDTFWQSQAVAQYLGKPKVPNLNVAGWWDQEDYYGPMKIYQTLEKNDTDHLNYLVVGPWNHGGWGRAGDRLGKISFGSDTSKYFRENVEAPWFAFWLKDKGSRNFPEALTFQTGNNSWVKTADWPPTKDIRRVKLYMHANGKLSFDTPKEQSAALDSYLSDPAHPVPYRHRPIGPTYPGPGWAEWLVEDQRFVHLRPDVLSWETEPLDNDFTVEGDIIANLFASTTGTDSDWIVKLIDEYPEDEPNDMGGYQLIIADEVMRARFRDSFEHPKPLEAGKVYWYPIDIHDANHTFRRGHRIMVQVQSTWFPLIDRNPQKFVPNIFKANEADYRVETQRVFRSRTYPSNLDLPVADARQQSLR